MITLEQLEKWLVAPAETEHLEFKEAKSQYDTTKLMKYCVALANEGGGHLILGVSNKPPRQVVGTKAFNSVSSQNALKHAIYDKLKMHVELHELQHADGRVLVFKVNCRPAGLPFSYEGAYLMRSGESLVSMTPDRLKAIFAEDAEEWLKADAVTGQSADGVVALLDTQGYFDLMGVPYPTSRDAVLERLASEELIASKAGGWNITNLAAILLAKKLDAFPKSVSRKAPRVVIYEGKGKQTTKAETTGKRGYAVGFDGLVSFVHTSAPTNRVIEQTIREEVRMFPEQALRELIANAMVHQDYSASGSSIMIEMYSDRIEITNPGPAPIAVERFIDEYKSRNESLADLMRRMGICEEKGSGIDKVVRQAEVYQLPAPDFRKDDLRTTAVMFAHREFKNMSKRDRVRACYQHCSLLYVSNEKMSNKSLRERFGLDDSGVSLASQTIAATKDAGLIRADEEGSGSTRYARYLPWWA